jgi:hypothetical protein
MARKPHERSPGSADDELTAEGRKAIFGKSEGESAPQDKDRQREYCGPGPTGHRDSAGSDKGS